MLLPALLIVASSNSSEPMTKGKKVEIENKRLSDKGLEFITGFESIENEVYNDGRGFLTGGIGHKLRPEEKQQYSLGSPVSDEQVQLWLKDDVAEAERCVNNWVTVELSQSAFDMLVSLVFNIGCGNFKRSTLLKKLNRGDYVGASNEFKRWKFSNGRVMTGLIKRRAAEAQIFREAGLDDEIVT